MTLKRFTILATLLIININSFSQEVHKLIFSNIKVSMDGKDFESADKEIPFEYGKKSLDIVLYSADNTIITASFKLKSASTKRSEIKNSSVELYANYNAIHAGESRKKTTEKIYYFDQERTFETNEAFSYKTNKYDVKVIKLKFKTQLID
jgi:hypothetical protein